MNKYSYCSEQELIQYYNRTKESILELQEGIKDEGNGPSAILDLELKLTPLKESLELINQELKKRN